MVREATQEMPDQQETIDEIVTDFLSNESERRANAALIFQARISVEDVQAEADLCGTLIPEHILEFDRDWIELIEESLTPERATEVSEGAPPTDTERHAFRERVIQWVRNGDGDADVIPGYWIQRLQHTDGRAVFACVTVIGYSFSGVEDTFQGLFQSAELALSHLAELGVILSAE